MKQMDGHHLIFMIVVIKHIFKRRIYTHTFLIECYFKVEKGKKIKSVDSGMVRADFFKGVSTTGEKDYIIY